MTQLWLILGVNIAGLAFAGLLARWLVPRDTGSIELRRLQAAVLQAVGGFMRRQHRLVVLSALALGAAVFGLYLLAGSDAALGSVESAFWAALAVGLGATAATWVTHVAATVAARASVSTLLASRFGTNRALSVALRTGGMVGLLVETVSVLGLLAVFALVFAMAGGVSAPRPQAAAIASAAAGVCVCFALGAALAALLYQRAGAAYHVAADAGGDLAGQRDAGLDPGDPRNPAAVSDLIGDHVGRSAGRAADLFLSCSVANAAVLVLGMRVLAQYEGQAAVLSLASLPFVIRALGVIACSFGLAVARATEGGDAEPALWRGQATTTIIALGGSAGAALWLAPGNWHWFFLAALAGILPLVVVTHAGRYRIARRFSPLRDLLEALRVGDATGIAQGLAVGMRAVLLPLVGLGVAAAAAWQLGNASSMPLGSSFAASCALMAMLATAPYLLAVATLGSIADGAQGVAAMAPGAVAEDAERCTARLDDAGFTGRSVAEIHLILTSGMAALLAATTLPALFHEELVIDLSQPTVVYCGALGMGFVIAYCASGLLSAVRGARSVALEVERQLRGFPREGGLVQVPREHTPSYRAAMDVTVRAALGRALLPVAAVLLGPALLGAGLLFAFRSQAPTLAAEGLVSFVILASITGLCVALAGDATRATLSAARRASRPRGITPAYGAAVSGDVLADLVGNATAPAAHLCAKAASVALLAVHAFLI